MALNRQLLLLLVLGPLLFLEYINDLSVCVSACLLMGLFIVQSIDQFEEWADKWMMIYSIDKCEVLQVSLSNLKPTSYFLYNSRLRTIGRAKYLGVLLDSKLSILPLLRKANNVLALLKCNLYHCNPEIRS